MMIEITAEILRDEGALLECIDIFRTLFPTGLRVESWGQGNQVGLLMSPLRRYWGWFVRTGLIPAWSMAEVDLKGVNLSGADLADAYLYGINLRDADLRGADLSGAYLHDADLRGANLGNAGLYSADLSDADLSGAYLRGAYLYGVKLSGAKLSGASF